MSNLEIELIKALRDLESATYEASYENDYCVSCEKDPTLHECRCKLSGPRDRARAILARPEIDHVRKMERRAYYDAEIAKLQAERDAV